jgi:hypothetical protein
MAAAAESNAPAPQQGCSMADDERLARQMQNNEMAGMYGGRPGMGGQPGMYAQPGMMGGVQGQPGGPFIANGTIVQGSPVTVQGGPGMQPAYGQGYGYNPYAPQAVPIGATMGAPGQMMAMQQLDVNDKEITVLRYRCSIMCFACIDFVATMFEAFYLFSANDDEDSDSSMFGTKKNDSVGIDRSVMGVLQLMMLIGPISGYYGAKLLKRAPLGIYLAFCIVKTTFSVILAALYFYFWYMLGALIQLYITKIVFSCYQALGYITPQRASDLLHPEFVVGRPIGRAYW